MDIESLDAVSDKIDKLKVDIDEKIDELSQSPVETIISGKTRTVDEYEYISFEDRLEGIKRDVEMLKKIKKQRKKLEKLEEEKDKVIKKINQENQGKGKKRHGDRRGKRRKD